MVKHENDLCPKCGGITKYYDYVRRIQRGTEGKKNYILLSRVKCTVCGSVHRVIPDDVIPYVQYEKTIVEGCKDDVDDYPCDMTIKRWSHQKQGL